MFRHGTFGLVIKFPNGVELSTAVGMGTFTNDGWNVRERKDWSNDAEIAVMKDGEWITEKMIADLFPERGADMVLGYVTMDEWLMIFDWCRSYGASVPVRKFDFS